MEELKTIMQKFVESGWDLIAIPAQQWLDGKSDKESLISAIKQADEECGSCGCELDPLYKRALSIQCNNSVIRNISYFMKVACRSTGSNDYSNSTVMNLPKGINRGWQHFMSFKTYQCSIHIEHDRFYHNIYIFIHSSTI